MTLDEHIQRAEEDAKKAEFDTEWGIGNYFIDRTAALEYAKDCRRLAEWLKELKQLREQTRWIPVSERLPEKSGYYWCTFGGTNLTGSDYYTTESDAKKLFDDPEEFAGWESQNVIAWMPLPPSYKPQESEE